jgi:hypothetical protein
MRVSFERTGERRYGVRVVVEGHPPRYTNPAPGFHEYIPHDLVHYVAEAELRMRDGVFGRAARGGSAFLLDGEALSGRARSREQRRQRKREARLNERDAQAGSDMERAERLALLCDVAWRRRNGQRGDLKPWLAPAPPTTAESAIVERLVDRLDEVAQRWNALPVGGSLSFEWPSVQPL